MSTMTEPLVTVIIPAYNAEVFLERTLRSALAQTYRNFDILIIDDGSRDDTRLVAERTAAGDSRVRIISVENGGVARARNIGIELSAAEYVAFLDADDLWHPRKLELQVAALSADGEGQQTAAVYALSRKIDLDDRVIESNRLTDLNGFIFARHLYAKPVGNGSSLLVRRDAALAVGGYDPSWAAQGIGGCEDLDFELKIVARYPIAAVPLYLIGYRMYEGSMSSNKLSMALGALATIDQHIGAFPELPTWAAKKARGAILEYTVGNLRGGSHWSRLPLEIARLLKADPVGGLSYLAQSPRRNLARLVSSGARQAPLAAKRPLFVELSPEAGTEIACDKTSLRERRMLTRLAPVDADLQRKRLAKM